MFLGQQKGPEYHSKGSTFYIMQALRVLPWGSHH